MEETTKKMSEVSERLRQAREKSKKRKELLGTIYIYYVSTKLNLPTYFLQKTRFFRQNRRSYFSTLHFDEFFIL